MTGLDGKKIAIVGGGPGGLTLARLLQHCGAQVSLYERDQSRSARVQGSALDLHEDSGLAALEAAGLMDAFWANHRPDLDSLRLTDLKGTILYDYPRRMCGAGKRPEIERGPLRDLLLDFASSRHSALGLQARVCGIAGRASDVTFCERSDRTSRYRGRLRRRELSTA